MFLLILLSSQMKKGAAFCDALGWFDAGALFGGAGVIYMKASFPGRALPGGRQIFGETKKAPFLKE